MVDWFYDAAVKGADAIDKRNGFTEMLDRIASNGVRTILVESPDRFARDLAVQLAGHDFLKATRHCTDPGHGSRFFHGGHPHGCPGASGARGYRSI